MRAHLKVVPVVPVVLLSLSLPRASAGQVSVGLRGGLNVSTLGGEDSGYVRSKTGPILGGFVEVALSDVLGVQLGAGFSRKGAERPTLGIDYEETIDYVEVPLLLRVSPVRSGAVGFSFSLGPVISFAAGCTVSGRESGVRVRVDCDHPGMDASVKSTEMGAMAGVGVDVAVSPRASLVIDALYNLGLTGIDDSAADRDVTNRAAALVAGVKLAVGR